MRKNKKSEHYINSIRLFNFQSHKESELELSPGLNVIIGQSDSGKTSIIRALNWIVWNRPSGDEFINKNAKSCFAEITFSDGAKISRNKEKNGKANYYIVNGQQLKAIGQDVPKEVSDILNLSEINIQKQFDAPFLISETPGQIAKALNEISRLEDIDTTISNINSSIKQEKEKIEDLQQYNEKLKVQLNSFPDIEKLEQKLVDIEKLDEQEKTAVMNLNKIKTLLREYEEEQKELIENKSLYEAIPNIELKLERLLTAKQTYKDKELLINRLSALLITEKKEMLKLKEIQTRLINLKTEWNKIKPNECPLCGGNWS